MNEISDFLPTLRKLSQYAKLTDIDICNQFKKKHGLDVQVEKNEICHGCFSVSTGTLKFLLTERHIPYLNKTWGRVTNLQNRANQLSIALPLYIGQGTLDKAFHAILSSDNLSEQSNEWLFKNFNLEIALAYFNKYFCKSDSLSPYKTIIYEAIEAFYLGYDHIAIMSLFPVFEGGLRNLLVNLVDGDSNTVSSEAFEKGLKNLLLKWGRKQVLMYDWHPGFLYNTDVEIDFFTHLNPQCDVLNSTRSFFSNVIYKPSNDNLVQSFNRHLTVHLLKNNFNEPSNFVRIFLALTHITFAESLYNQSVPFFWEGVDEFDKKIASFIDKSADFNFSTRRKAIKAFGLNLY